MNTDLKERLGMTGLCLLTFSGPLGKAWNEDSPCEREAASCWVDAFRLMQGCCYAKMLAGNALCANMCKHVLTFQRRISSWTLADT